MIKKMLVGYIIDGKHSGIDKYLLGLCDIAHQNGVKLDLLTIENDSELKAILNDKGAGLFTVPSLKNPFAQYNAIKDLILKNGYDAVYFNISEAFNCAGLLAAAKCKVPVRMLHSHSSGVDRHSKYTRLARTLIHKFFKTFIHKKATHLYSCSDVATRWMFPEKAKAKIIYNAVDAEKFGFSEQKRKDTRAALGIGESTPAFIHIGNFCYAKNNFFLMEVMKKITESEPEAKLICAGDGYDFDAVREYAKTLGISDSVLFLGVRKDIPELLSAADCFIFPSRFEGLSITCVEAQFSGLPCIFSTGVSEETKISDKVIFLDFENKAEWAKKALEFAKEARKSENISDKFRKRYDISFQKEQLYGLLKGEYNE